MAVRVVTAEWLCLHVYSSQLLIMNSIDTLDLYETPPPRMALLFILILYFLISPSNSILSPSFICNYMFDSPPSPFIIRSRPLPLTRPSSPVFISAHPSPQHTLLPIAPTTTVTLSLSLHLPILSSYLSRLPSARHPLQTLQTPLGHRIMDMRGRNGE